MTRTIIQLYRGTTAQNDAFTGSAGELSFDTTTNQVRVHDGTTVGGHIIGSGSGYHPDLFDWKWADHELNDVQWLRADTFSWQSGAVYQAAFNDLFNDIYISTSWRATGYANVYTASPTPEVGDTVYSDSACTTSVGTVTSYDSGNNQMSYNSVTWDYNSNSYVTPASETVAGYTVDVYTGHSGKKIVSWQDESNVASIYSATGVAWYYIIDIANKRFKLPRVNSEKEKLLTSAAVVTSSTTIDTTQYPAMKIGNASGQTYNSGGMLAVANNGIVNRDYATRNTIPSSDWLPSNLKADLENGTSYYSGKKYLYFYVGNFTQTALENTAGLNASLFNGKVDLDGSNATFPHIVEKQDPTSANNYTWYRKYSDGWVEQGGRVPSNTGGTYAVTMPVEMADANYNFVGTGYKDSNDNGFVIICIDSSSMSTTGFTVYPRYAINGSTGSPSQGGQWQVSGKAA